MSSVSGPAANRLDGDLPDVAARFAAAREALNGLASALAAEVGRRGWPLAGWERPISPGGRIGEWPGQWWGACAARPEGPYVATRFDWVLWGFGDQGGGEPPRFATGMVWSHWQTGPNPLHNAEWVARMLELDVGDGWGKFEPPDAYDGIRMYRSVSLERVAAEGTQEAQVALLADLVVSTFALLERNAPIGLETP